MKGFNWDLKDLGILCKLFIGYSWMCVIYIKNIQNTYLNYSM